jgi:hypothetical protein
MLKRHLFLHIGTHKTGSTTIQHYLKEHRSQIEGQGFYYPMEGAYFYPPEASPSLLAHAVLNNRPKYIGRTEVNLDTCVHDMRRDIELSPCPNVIVSSEHFSLASTREDVLRIANVFSGLFEKITVVVYLRRQDTRLESYWSQHVKTGLIVQSFSDYLTAHAGWNYSEMLKPWIEVFSQECLVIRPFEKSQFFENNLVSDFLHVVGCQVEVQDFIQRNASPPVEFLELIRIFGTSLPGFLERRAFQRILRTLSIKIDHTKYTMFSPEGRQQFLELHRESNQQVARDLLGRFDGRLFYDKETSDLPSYGGLSLERFAEISKQIIIALANLNNKTGWKTKNSINSVKPSNGLAAKNLR